MGRLLGLGGSFVVVGGGGGVMIVFCCCRIVELDVIFRLTAREEETGSDLSNFSTTMAVGVCFLPLADLPDLCFVTAKLDLSSREPLELAADPWPL